VIFLAGLVIGVALGTTAIGFLAFGAYDRGYDAAMRAPWRRELDARRAAIARRVSTAAA
jgi:hypothetical protein